MEWIFILTKIGGTGAAQFCKNWVGKTSNFDDIYSRYIQVTRILQFWGIFVPMIFEKTGWANAHPAHPVAPPLQSFPMFYTSTCRKLKNVLVTSDSSKFQSCRLTTRLSTHREWRRGRGTGWAGWAFAHPYFLETLAKGLTRPRILGNKVCWLYKNRWWGSPS